MRASPSSPFLSKERIAILRVAALVKKYEADATLGFEDRVGFFRGVCGILRKADLYHPRVRKGRT